MSFSGLDLIIPASYEGRSPCWLLRPQPLDVTGGLRVRTLIDRAALQHDLVPLHLVKEPEDDPVYAGFLGGVTAYFDPRRQYVARHVVVEGRRAIFDGDPTLELLLDRGLPDTRGRHTEARTGHLVDDRIFSKQGQRPRHIATGDGLYKLLPQCRWIALGAFGDSYSPWGSLL